LKCFGSHIDLGFRDWTSNLLKCLKLDLVWILVFVSVLLNYLKPSGMIACKYLDTQFRTYQSSGLVIGVILNQWSCRFLFSVYCWTDCKSRDILFVFGREPTLIETRVSCSIFFRHNNHLVFGDATWLLCLDTKVTFEAFERGCHLLETWRSRQIILDMDVIWNEGLLCATRQLNLISRFEPRISTVWRLLKRPGSFNSLFTLTVILFDEIRVWRFLKAQKLFLDLKALTFFQIFSKIFTVQMDPKAKPVTYSSHAATASTAMDDAPPQEAPISGK